MERKVAENWKELTEDLFADGYGFEEVFSIVVENWKLASGLFINELKSAGVI